MNERYDDDIFTDMISFLKAQNEAEERGEHEFTCPLCNGKASWGRATGYNNHLRCGCRDCGFSMME